MLQYYWMPSKGPVHKTHPKMLHRDDGTVEKAFKFFTNSSLILDRLPL
jgi:hypothetical protein